MTVYGVWVETLVCVEAPDFDTAELIALNAVGNRGAEQAAQVEEQKIVAISERIQP